MAGPLGSLGSLGSGSGSLGNGLGSLGNGLGSLGGKGLGSLGSLGNGLGSLGGKGMGSLGSLGNGLGSLGGKGLGSLGSLGNGLGSLGSLGNGLGSLGGLGKGLGSLGSLGGKGGGKGMGSLSNGFGSIGNGSNGKGRRTHPYGPGSYGKGGGIRELAPLADVLAPEMVQGKPLRDGIEEIEKYLANDNVEMQITQISWMHERQGTVVIPLGLEPVSDCLPRVSYKQHAEVLLRVVLAQGDEQVERYIRMSIFQDVGFKNTMHSVEDIDRIGEVYVIKDTRDLAANKHMLRRQLQKYKDMSYHALTFNCHHFTKDFYEFATGRDISA